MAQLAFKDISVRYKREDGTAVQALSGVNLEISKGESVAVIGPSGCGKSTLLQLASGLMQSREKTARRSLEVQGSVLCAGEELGAPRMGTALILQSFGLLPWKTVQQNAELGLQIHGMGAQERRSRAQDALAQVGLAGFERAYPRELSGGMQQRLALARAIAMQADTLLMDEPLSALDALLRDQLQEVLLQLWKDMGHTQLLITHSIEEAVYLGQRIVVMSARPGRIVAQIENPQMGSREYRSSVEFFAQCNAVHAALDEAISAAQGGDAR